MEHVDLLRFNGFDVLVDEDADVGERVKLIAQPVSKDTVFDTGGACLSSLAQEPTTGLTSSSCRL